MWNGHEWFWPDYARGVQEVLAAGPNLLDVGTPVPFRKELASVPLPTPPPRVWTLDYPGPWPSSVDLTADAAFLPFPSGALDGVICKEVLEHVRFPRETAQELVRVLRPGGKLFATMIFIHPYHAAHYSDFWRFTTDAVHDLFEGLELRIRPAGGWAYIARAYAPARVRALLWRKRPTQALNLLDRLWPAHNATVMNYVVGTRRAVGAVTP